MGLLESIFGKGKRIEDPKNKLTGELLRLALDGGISCEDFNTSPDHGALTFTPVFAGIRAISETVASFPCVVYRKRGEGRERDTENPVYKLLHDRPNESQIPFTFWDVIVKRMIRRGNAYVYIVRDNGGRIAALQLLENARVTVKVVSGKNTYIYGGKYAIDPADLLHFIGFTNTGLIGVPLLQYAQQTLALGMAAEKYGLKYFTEGESAGGTIELNGVPTPDQLKIIKESWAQRHSGENGRHGTAIIPNGKYSATGNSNEASQFLETRKFEVIEVCRLLRIPPHIIQDLERATFTNIEAQGREFLQFCIRPWLKRIEGELNGKLFVDDPDCYAEFLADDLLRADTQTRYAAYHTARTDGWMSVNDIRRMENLPPIDGGDQYLTPLNMTPVGNSSGADKSPPTNDPADAEDASDPTNKKD